ncbi:MAG: hypothetical protein E7255_04545 [Lachnospiraceae bacterium]|nr:hypothetical protein [Lachnospiraceae bacterium]
MFYKARLKTGNKTAESIRKQAKQDNWIGELSDKDIDNMIAYNNYFDGLEVIVAEAIGGTGYTLITWDKSADSNVKEALYIMEQDEYFGSYVNDRVGFDKVWGNGEYEPAGSIGFTVDEVEILEQIGR